MNFTPIFFGCDGMDGILAVEGFDVELANNLMFMSPFTPTSEDEAIQKFVKDYDAAYGGTPNQFAADAYDQSGNRRRRCNSRYVPVRCM